MHYLAVLCSVLLLATFTNCQKDVKDLNGFKEGIPSIGSNGKNSCTCICELKKFGIGPIVTACASGIKNKVDCEKFCFEECATAVLECAYGFKKNKRNGITCLYDKTMVDYSNCTNYNNSVASNAFEIVCRDYCKGTAKFPKDDVICNTKKKFPKESADEKGKHCSCLCKIQKSGELLVEASHQNCNQKECEEFCKEECEKLRSKYSSGFKRNRCNGVTCLYHLSSFDYHKCTNYHNSIPSNTLQTTCKGFFDGTSKFPDLDVLCADKKKSPKDEL